MIEWVEPERTQEVGPDPNRSLVPPVTLVTPRTPTDGTRPPSRSSTVWGFRRVPGGRKKSETYSGDPCDVFGVGRAEARIPGTGVKSSG